MFLMLHKVRNLKLPPTYSERLAEFVTVMSNIAFSFKYSLLRSLFVGSCIQLESCLTHWLEEESNFVTLAAKFEFSLEI